METLQPNKITIKSVVIRLRNNILLYLLYYYEVA